MPGAGIHTTIIQRLAQLANDPTGSEFGNVDAKLFLTDPDKNADWGNYATPEALQARYANLGALGPDIFYLMLDYGGNIQQFEDTVMAVAATFRCVGELSSKVNDLIDSDLNSLTHDVWSEIQTTFGYLKGILIDGVLDFVVGEANLWMVFLPMREVDNYQENWYWADFLHYAKTGCFTQKLLDNAAALHQADPSSPPGLCMSAYALGYLSHYVADSVGHPFINRIVESPWRNHWQRHHLVENFMDASVWAHYHVRGPDPGSTGGEQALDTMAAPPGQQGPDGPAEYHYARINDLCNVGSQGIDPLLDGLISQVCARIDTGFFPFGTNDMPKLSAPDDPIFTTWTRFMADTMQETYPPGQERPTRMGRYPTPDDIAGAYGAYRLFLSLATEDDVEAPKVPDIVGDLESFLASLWARVSQDLGSIPPPPALGGESLSLDSVWDAVTKYIKWLGQVAAAVLEALGDFVAGLIETPGVVAAETIKAALYLLNSLLYSIYHSVRMTLVMSAYATPFIEDLTATWGPLDLTTLWTLPEQGAGHYPIEPVVSERDLLSDSAHPFSPYHPYFKPSTMAPVNIETPHITFHPQYQAWRTPLDMLESAGPGSHDMFSADGPAPATKVQLPNTSIELETFDGSQRYFGGVLANCVEALRFAVPYLSGTDYPAGKLLPDYNLDGDRGFAWPCWDVDWTYQNPAAPFPWNGADPFPDDTQSRIASGTIEWGASSPTLEPDFRARLTPTDPFGHPRHGQAFINAHALGVPGVCNFMDFPFHSIVVNPNRKDLLEYDPPIKAVPISQSPPNHGPLPGDLLSADYFLADHPEFLNSNSADPNAIDVVNVWLHLPYTGPKTPENDGRLVPFLRAHALTSDPKTILTNAASIGAGGPMLPLQWPTGPITDPGSLVGTPALRKALVKALAQLAVTGRRAFEKFAQWAPDAAALTHEVEAAIPNFTFDSASLDASVQSVLNDAYTALWCIRSNDPAWRAARSGLGWIAVSGIDDTPHRPVNVPTAPYPQYDIKYAVQNANPDRHAHQTVDVTTRCMVASAHRFVGPNDSNLSGFTNPDPSLLADPNSSPGSTVGHAPWSIPDDTFTIPPQDKIIIYVHGGGSRAEEAVDVANWLIVEGNKVGESYTVISFDLPNSAFGAPFPISDVVGKDYDYSQLWVLQFEQRYIIAFIEALRGKGVNVDEQIVAVMGGSLGGNMSMLMTDHYGPAQKYLQTIVAWSVTAMAPDTYLGVLNAAQLGAATGRQSGVTSAETDGTEAAYIQKMYTTPLIPGPIYVPPQPITWYRGGYDEQGTGDWQPEKDQEIARSRFDRYEIYSAEMRHWTNAIDLEQIAFSFQDDLASLKWVTTPAQATLGPSNLMLIAGDNDNFNPNAIYDSTINVTRAHRLTARGKAEFWLDTGHSVHNERPHLLAREVVYFLTHPTAGDSPSGTVVSTPPSAAYSLPDR